ncbi:DUF5320 domain-containing protein [Desulfofustis limnaeus]|uniref:DUF5320 domain-containing protein n=1 Tax=Desulfofustis limnaeus TaxID=2740163 RepID=A0ABM7WBW4_9BACT|nr:hypothetical protein DPPLL_28660 [Desulfofustis limnaeus]
MPGFDKTGPMGVGPMTGGGLGRCTGVEVPSGVFGRGMGRGRGCGRGWAFSTGSGRGRGRGYAAGYPPAMPNVSAEQEVDFLKTEAQRLEQQLQRINDRLGNLQQKPE